MMVYNTPLRTGVNITHDCLESILNIADVACIGIPHPEMGEELRALAARKMAEEKPGQTLQATALVHEAYLRLVDTGPHAHQELRTAGPGETWLCTVGRAADDGESIVNLME